MNESELMHYGVLGMKWGVRKASKYMSVDRISKLKKKRIKYEQKSDKYAAKVTKRMNKGRDTFVNNLIRGKSMAAHHRRKASRYDLKSRKARDRANRIKWKLEKEARYVKKMQTKVRKIPLSELNAGYSFAKKILK